MKVLLVHGLGRTRLSLALLGRRLSASGHTPEYFAYSSLVESLPHIVGRLVMRLRALAADGEEVGLVGHSLGGLLLREAVAKVPELRVKHLVMLGTPNRLPRMGRVVYPRFPFRMLRGSCGRHLTDPAWFGRLPKISVPFTSVAGTRGWRGRFSPFKGEPNDGAVAVSETMVNDSDKPELVPAIHTLIMNSRVVHRLIAERLGRAVSAGSPNM